MGDFVHCISQKYIYHATYLSEKVFRAYRAVGKFMTECFMSHESFAMRLHVGTSLEDCAKVDF